MIGAKHWRYAGRLLESYQPLRGARPESTRRGYFHQHDGRATFCPEDLEIMSPLELWDQGKMIGRVVFQPAADLAPGVE